MEHYLIWFRDTGYSDPRVVGCLRFDGTTTHEQRQASLEKWLAKNRPHKPALGKGETAWVNGVKIEDAP